MANLNNVVSKILGRKLVVLILGFIALMVGKIESWPFVAICGLYIGGVASEKIAKIKNGG